MMNFLINVSIITLVGIQKRREHFWKGVLWGRPEFLAPVLGYGHLFLWLLVISDAVSVSNLLHLNSSNLLLSLILFCLFPCDTLCLL